MTRAGDNSAPAARPTLTVYSRRQCHLCEEMVAGLREIQARFAFDVEIVDVDADARLRREFGMHVPVLVHGKTELCRHRLEPGGVTAYLSNFR